VSAHEQFRHIGALLPNGRHIVPILPIAPAIDAQRCPRLFRFLPSIR
jgi:hypothetical protein